MTRVRTILRSLVPLGLVLLTGGCNLSKPYPAKQLYAIDAGQPERSAAETTRPALRVQPVRVTNPFNEQMFHYRVGSARFEEDYYATFVDAPGRLITAELVDWLTATRLYEAVLDASSPVHAERSIQLVVNELYIDRTDASARRAVIAARVFLIDEREIESRVLLSRDYRESEMVNGDDGDALAAAWGAALGRIFEGIVNDLRAAEGDA